MLSKDIELSLELLMVKEPVLRDIAITIVRSQNDKWLEYGRFFATCGRTKDGAVCRHLSPT